MTGRDRLGGDHDGACRPPSRAPRRRHGVPWFAVGVWLVWRSVHAIVLVALGRVIGFAFGPVLAVARIWRRKRVDLVAVAYLAATILAIALVIVQQSVHTGEPLAFARAQEAAVVGIAVTVALLDRWAAGAFVG